MALYGPHCQPPDNQEEEQLRSEDDVPPPGDHDRLAEEALGGSDSTVNTAPRPRLDSVDNNQLMAQLNDLVQRYRGIPVNSLLPSLVFFSLLWY